MNSRLGTLLLSVVLGVVMSGAATAQTAAPQGGQPSREQVIQLMTAMGIPQSVNESLQQTQIRVKDAAREAFLKENPQASEAATLKQLNEVVDKTPFFKFEDLADVVVPIYQKKLTASDVQAGVDFYSSPAGKRLLERIPEIMQETNEEGGKIVQAKMQAYGEQLEKNLQAFQTTLRAEQPAAAAKPDAGAAKPDEKSPEQKSK